MSPDQRRPQRGLLHHPLHPGGYCKGERQGLTKACRIGTRLSSILSRFNFPYLSGLLCLCSFLYVPIVLLSQTRYYCAVKYSCCLIRSIVMETNSTLAGFGGSGGQGGSFPSPQMASQNTKNFEKFPGVDRRNRK